MENIEKENKRLKVLIIILVVVLLGLGCYHYYVTYINVGKDNEKEVTNNNVTENNISYSGEYTYSKDNGEVIYTATIDLLDNGTFYAKETATMAGYFYGTYKISENVLVLNYDFTMANVQGFYTLDVNKTVEYNIKNNIISGTKNDMGIFASNDDIILKKESDNLSVQKEFIQQIINQLRK